MIDKGTKRALQHTSRCLLQRLRRFHLRPLGSDTLGAFADWAGRKVGSVVCLAFRTGKTVPPLPCMRISSYLQLILLNFIVTKLAEDVLRAIPGDQNHARRVPIRRAVL